MTRISGRRVVADAQHVCSSAYGVGNPNTSHVKERSIVGVRSTEFRFVRLE